MSVHRVSFESDQIGTTPEGWAATLTGKGDSKWTVETDETAPSRLKVLKQSGRATYPLLLKNDTNIKDGFVEVWFKAIAGSQDRAAGIIWRARDANNYYVVRANALEDNFVLYKTVDGIRSALDIVGRKGGYGLPFRFRPTLGIACGLISKPHASKPPSTAISYSRSTIPLSPIPGRWGSGRRRTA